MKRLSRWSMAIVATFVLALSLVGGFAKQALADTTPVTSEAELLAAIAAAPADGSQSIVQVNADFTITAPVQVPANKNIRLTGSGTITSAMTGSNHFYMFKIASGGAVTLDGATIDGNNTAFAVENRGSFTLLRGVIKNGKAKPYPGNNGVVLTTGAGAKFVMAGGTIQDSTVDNALGGAVTVANGATGELRDGTIQNTTLTNQYSGSVLVKNADFTMTGGTITGGNASTINSSGGLMLYALDPNGETTTATMGGGYITNNKSVDGAGVYVYAGNVYYGDSKSKADFTFNGGSITNNVAS